MPNEGRESLGSEGSSTAASGRNTRRRAGARARKKNVYEANEHGTTPSGGAGPRARGPRFRADRLPVER